MYQFVTKEDFFRLEGEAPPQLVIDGELQRLGGEGWDGFNFRVRVLKHAGYDVDHPPAYPMRAEAYNRIARSLNRLGDGASAQTLCEDLGI